MRGEKLQKRRTSTTQIAYQKKYSSENVTLLYPKTENISKDNIEFSSKDGVVVRVKFVDLFNLNTFYPMLGLEGT